MKYLNVTKKEIDLESYVKRSALQTDFSILINEDTTILIDDKPALTYAIMKEWDVEPLRKCLLQTKYDTSTRSSGLKTTSRVFGYQPRIPMRRDFCTKTSLAKENPKTNELISSYGQKIVPLYRAIFQETFEQHSNWAHEKVKKDWKIENTPFTSGIVNKNNPLKYHFDAGNIQGVCSCMLALKSSSAGGYLSLPELGIGLEIADKSLTIFDGQSLLHGVTPIRQLSEQAHRFTIVYYTLHQMWKCEPLSLELARIRQVKTERERKRAGLSIVTQHGVDEGMIEE